MQWFGLVRLYYARWLGATLRVFDNNCIPLTSRVSFMKKVENCVSQEVYNVGLIYHMTRVDF